MPRSIFVSIALAALAGACAATQAPLPAADCELPPPADRAGSCPLGVDGARVQVADLDDGVLLTFTSPDRLEELRRRTRAAAELHGPGEHSGLGHDGEHAKHVRGGFHHGLRAFELPPARIVVEDIEDGAALRLTAVFATDIESLRAKVRARAEAMKTCR